jgi:hypothetical protein
MRSRCAPVRPDRRTAGNLRRTHARKHAPDYVRVAWWLRALAAVSLCCALAMAATAAAAEMAQSLLRRGVVGADDPAGLGSALPGSSGS